MSWPIDKCVQHIASFVERNEFISSHSNPSTSLNPPPTSAVSITFYRKIQCKRAIWGGRRLSKWKNWWAPFLAANFKEFFFHFLQTACHFSFCTLVDLHMTWWREQFQHSFWHPKKVAIFFRAYASVNVLLLNAILMKLQTHSYSRRIIEVRMGEK